MFFKKEESYQKDIKNIKESEDKDGLSNLANAKHMRTLYRDLEKMDNGGKRKRKKKPDMLEHTELKADAKTKKMVDDFDLKKYEKLKKEDEKKNKARRSMIN